MANYIRSLFTGYSFGRPEEQRDQELDAIIIDESSEEELIEGLRRLSIDDFEEDKVVIEIDTQPLEEKEGYRQVAEEDTQIDMMGVYDVFETTSIPTDYKDVYAAFVATLTTAIKTGAIYVDFAKEKIDTLKGYPATKPLIAVGAAGLDISAAFVFSGEDEDKGKTVSNILKKLAVRIARPDVAKAPIFVRLGLYIIATGGAFALSPLIAKACAAAGVADMGMTVGPHIFKIITGFVQKSLFQDFSSWSTRSRKAAQAEAADEEDSDDEGPSKPGPYTFDKERKSTPALLFDVETGIFPEGDKKIEAFCERKFDGPLLKLQDERGVPHPMVLKMVKGGMAVATIFAQIVASGSFFALTTLQAFRKEAKRVLLEQPRLLHLLGHLLANGITAYFMPFGVFKVVSGFSATIITVYVKKEMKDKLGHVPLLFGPSLPKVKGEKDLFKIAKKLASLGKSFKDKALTQLAKKLKEHATARTEQTKRLSQAIDKTQNETERKDAEKMLADVKEIYNGLLSPMTEELAALAESRNEQILPDLRALPQVAKRLTDLAQFLQTREWPRMFEIDPLVKQLTAIAESLAESTVPSRKDLDSVMDSLTELFDTVVVCNTLLHPLRTQLAELADTPLFRVLPTPHTLLAKRLTVLAAYLHTRVWPESYETADLAQQLAHFAELLGKNSVLPRSDLIAVTDRLVEFFNTVKADKQVLPNAFKDLLSHITSSSNLVEKWKENQKLLPEPLEELSIHIERLTILTDITEELPALSRHLHAALDFLKGNDSRIGQIKKVTIVTGSALLAGIMNYAAPGSSPAQISTEIFTGSLKPVMSYIKPGLRYLLLPITVGAGYGIEHAIPILPIGTILGGVAAATAVTDVTTWMNVKDKKKNRKVEAQEKVNVEKKKAEVEFEDYVKPCDLSFDAFTDLRNAIFEGVKRVTEKPWQEAVCFTNFIKDHFNDVPTEVLARSELDTLHTALKSILLSQITDEMKEPAEVTISPEQMKAKAPVLDLRSFGPEAERLVAKWSQEFTDFAAAIYNYGRGSFEGLIMFVNGQPVQLDDAFKKEFPHIKTFVSPEEFAIKTAYICEAILAKAKEAAPKIDILNLQKAVAETVLVGAGEHNPISRHSFLLGCFSQFDAERKDSYSMQPVSNIEYHMAFSTNKMGSTLIAKHQVSQSSKLMDQSDTSIEYKKYTYTSELTKSFKDFTSPWIGTLTKS